MLKLLFSVWMQDIISVLYGGDGVWIVNKNGNINLDVYVKSYIVTIQK